MHPMLQLPLDAETIVRKCRKIRRELETTATTAEIRIAILGGSTTEQVKNILELFLLDKGIKANFYESEYNKWYEDACFDDSGLTEFNPQLVYFHVSFVDFYNHYFNSPDSENAVANFSKKLERAWNKLNQRLSCSIIQNNFEDPFFSLYGNLDFAKNDGLSHSVSVLNDFIVQYANNHENYYVQDIHRLSAQIGLSKWYDREAYHLYKLALSYNCIPYLAYNLASMIGALLGKSKKCLVLDLDNTLWGGIIGDDGADGIQIGHETAEGEQFYEFQEYVLSLKKRGVLLAVCSKNDLEVAKKGFELPDSLLKYDDFTSFVANWEPKSVNIKRIASEIGIGMDSLVFIDDNPMERNLVREAVPEVTVPEVLEGQPWSYIQALEDGKYFEQLVVSQDDLKRNQSYIENKKRNDLEQEYEHYDDFLKNLGMKAEIKAFADVYLDRITQLTNKSNQFNLTTKRYSRAEIESVANDDNFITLYGRLKDKFGDNGLVSVVIGSIKDFCLTIDLWLMSCRVLRRGFEYAMFSELLKLCREKGIKEIYGNYYKTAKNAMVKDFYKDLGFDCIEQTEEQSQWKISLEDFSFEKSFYVNINGSNANE